MSIEERFPILADHRSLNPVAGSRPEAQIDGIPMPGGEAGEPIELVAGDRLGVVAELEPESTGLLDLSGLPSVDGIDAFVTDGGPPARLEGVELVDSTPIPPDGESPARVLVEVGVTVDLDRCRAIGDTSSRLLLVPTLRQRLGPLPGWMGAVDVACTPDELQMTPPDVAVSRSGGAVAALALTSERDPRTDEPDRTWQIGTLPDGVLITPPTGTLRFGDDPVDLTVTVECDAYGEAAARHVVELTATDGEIVVADGTLAIDVDCAGPSVEFAPSSVLLGTRAASTAVTEQEYLADPAIREAVANHDPDDIIPTGNHWCRQSTNEPFPLECELAYLNATMTHVGDDDEPFEWAWECANLPDGLTVTPCGEVLDEETGLAVGGTLWPGGSQPIVATADKLVITGTDAPLQGMGAVGADLVVSRVEADGNVPIGEFRVDASYFEY